MEQEQYEEYEKPDITVIPIENENCILASSADDPDPGPSDKEEGSDLWSPFGLGKGIPD